MAEDSDDYSADFTDEDSDHATENISLHDALLNFYRRYAPSEIFKVDNILKKYAGREAVIFKALRRKYGAVPQFDLGRLLTEKYNANETSDKSSKSFDSSGVTYERHMREDSTTAVNNKKQLSRRGSELSNLVGDSLNSTISTRFRNFFTDTNQKQ